MSDTNARMILMEKALTRLTIIQEQQTAQTEKIIDSMDNFTKISLTVEQNAKDIDILHETVAKLHDRTNEGHEKSSEVKEWCTSLSFTRLKTAISVSTTIIVIVFGYLYSDVHNTTSRINAIEKDIIKLEMQHEELFHGKIKR